MTNLGYLEIVILTLQILISLGMIALTSYVTKKGENQATIEDTGKITKEVEDVKSYFTERTEWLKAELTADIQRQMNLFVKRNEALTQFFEDSFTVLILLRSGKRYRPDDLDALDNLIKETQDRVVRAISSYHRLTLYVQEESILTPALKARTSLSALINTWWGLAHKFRDALADEAREEERAKTTGNNSYFDQDKNDRPTGQAFRELRQGTDSLLNTLDDSLKEYGTALNTYFHSVDNSKALAATTGDSLEK